MEKHKPDKVNPPNVNKKNIQKVFDELERDLFKLLNGISHNKKFYNCTLCKMDLNNSKVDLH